MEQLPFKGGVLLLFLATLFLIGLEWGLVFIIVVILEFIIKFFQLIIEFIQVW